MPRSLLAVLLLLSGCCRTPPPAGPPRPLATSPEPRVVIPALSLEAVPASARALVCLGPALFSGPDRWLRRRPALLAELRQHLLGSVGVDLTGIQSLVAWSSSLASPTSYAVFVATRGSGTLRGSSAGDHRGVALFGLDGGKLLVAQLPGGLLLGTPAEVRLGIDRARGAAAGLPADAPILSLLPRPPRVDLLIGVDASGISGPQLQAAVQQFDLRAAVFTLENDLLSLRLGGARDKLAALKQLLTLALSGLLSNSDAQKQKAVAQGGLGEALGAIIAAHELRELVGELEPRVIGDTLLAEYRLPRLDQHGPLVLLGMAAAIAIPAFQKYLNRARASEASASLEAIRRGVEAYHQQHRGRGRAFQFPASTEWTPARSCCNGVDQLCPGDAALYDHPTWKTLQFQRSGTHRYQVRFHSQGKGKTARFSIEVRGDLDCDGIFSSYRLEGKLDDTGALLVAPPVTENELE